MQIHPITSNPAATGVTTAPKHEKSPTEQPQPQKVDNVVLSEKAKDLAAQKSGQGNVEEAKESLSAKALEGTSN